MISIVQGKVLNNNGIEIIVLTNGGVGYRIITTPSLSNKAKINSDLSAIVYLVVREGSMELYGFSNEIEKQLFSKLLLVSGIGPKSALHVLALGDIEEINLAISNGDVDYLTKVSGIGKKTAERIVVELKDKIVSVNFDGSSEGGKIGEVVEGLISLGYSAVQAREAVKKLPADKSSEELLREALKRLSR
ncbi:MAG: Holliday junction branch migration protein RuvA [Candidatus Magasanikbacteria bacterium CG10_big_fil_rev_8_21_14_0_10_36_32]|uniref:Holliday junction branch migration complex subunit RuvA n=1 Tax=Candidatus Magasanikbacteria bacterium CG10_big_fil_rev_8_21_14_0_10_36_32 TaxID=1974646 RepID=A0A2M6W6T6_9BACT|nr:MAG: Holliday junction branch migration protein RuvA [Candidatus Magasanikbacteria bacterium CG10_big_fil_rev_8_21_14_0_10_36_32]